MNEASTKSHCLDCHLLSALCEVHTSTWQAHVVRAVLDWGDSKILGRISKLQPHLYNVKRVQASTKTFKDYCEQTNGGTALTATMVSIQTWVNDYREGSYAMLMAMWDAEKSTSRSMTRSSN